MDHLANHVLNDEHVLYDSYRKIPTPALLSNLALSPTCLLAVGKKACWLINAKTPHSSHFVGTECAVRVYENPTHVLDWVRVKDFVAKYAPVGARVNIYWLHQGRSQLRKTATVSKPVGTRMSLPGCMQPFLNAINLPPFIDGPVDQEDTKCTPIGNWKPAHRSMALAVKRELNRNPADPQPRCVKRAASQ